MNISHLEINNSFSSAHSAKWFDIRNINSVSNLTEQYEDICHKHQIDKKWILMINPENHSLEGLTKSTKVDTSKILKVNTNKTKINLKNIESALSNGNCAAVILCNPSLKNKEIALLNQSAKQGQTECIVLNNNQKLH